MSTYIELVNRAEAAANAAEQSALNTANNKTIVQGLLERMQGIVGNAATLPVPSIQVDSSTGIVTAEYTATAGNVLSSTQRIGTLDISSLLVSGQGVATTFYKCASVSGPYTESHYAVTGSGTNEVNGDYNSSGNTNDGYPIYTYGNAAMFYSSAYEAWFITLELQNAIEQDPYMFSLFQSQQITGQWETTNGTGPAPTVSLETTEYNLAKTWTGYKAVFDSVTRTYSFEATATSGLTYSVITPVIGKIYADGALIETKLFTGIPENGLILYALMNASASEDELGNTLAVSGSPTFAADSGILCAEMTDSHIGYQSPSSGLTAYTLSIWMKRLQSGAALMTFSGGSYGSGGNELWIEYRDTGYISLGNGDADNPVIIITPETFSGWVNIVLVWTGSVFRLYVNGTQQGSDTSTEYNSQYSNLYPYINSLQRATSVKGAGKYASFRLYDHALTAAEIAALANEFTPTTA